MLAGGKRGVSNTTYYLYTGSNYWANSPYYFYTSHYANEFYIDSSGSLFFNTAGYDYGVRPSISLANGFTLSGGNGTLESPYVIS